MEKETVRFHKVEYTGSFNLADVLAHAKLTGAWKRCTSQAIITEIMKYYAGTLGVKITDEELQLASDLRRIELGLQKKAHMKRFLDLLGITAEIWEENLEAEMLRKAVQSQQGEISLGNVWNYLKLIPEIRNRFYDIVIARADNNQIEISDEELQIESDNLRRVYGLHKNKELMVYFHAQNMSPDDWEKTLHANIAWRKMIQRGIQPIYQEELFTRIAQHPAFNEVINYLMVGALVHARASSMGISVSDEEVAQMADAFRRAHKLHKLDHFKLWLASNQMMLEDFEFMLETRILVKKFFQKNDILFSPEELLQKTLASSAFIDVVRHYIVDLSMIEKAMQFEIVPDDEDMQYESDLLRRVLGLHKSADMKAYLEQNDITPEQWEMEIFHKCTIDQLKEFLANEDAILDWLDRNQGFRKKVVNGLLDEFARETVEGLTIQW